MARTAGYTVTAANPTGDSETNPVLKKGAGNAKGVLEEEEEEDDDDEREVESEEDGSATGGRGGDVTEKKLDEQYVKRLEKFAIDLLERMGVLKKDDKSKINRQQMENALDLLELLWMVQGGEMVGGKHDRMLDLMHHTMYDMMHDMMHGEILDIMHAKMYDMMHDMKQDKKHNMTHDKKDNKKHVEITWLDSDDETTCPEEDDDAVETVE